MSKKSPRYPRTQARPQRRLLNQERRSAPYAELSDRARAAIFVVGSLLGLALSLLTGCSSSPEAGQSVIDKANLYLSSNDCTDALATILPVYDSINTDNDVRLITASAYACNANVNFFSLVGNLASNSAALAGGGLWGLMAKLFPATTQATDKTVESAYLATDALQAALKPGAVIIPSDYINKVVTNFNPGSVNYVDRTDDTNAYLLFVSMAMIGAMENRYATISSQANHEGTMPWVNVATFDMTDNHACAYAAAIMNLKDAIDSMSATTTGPMQKALSGLQVVFNNNATGLDVACKAGCSAAVAGCAGATCTACPSDLRDRTRCTGVANDNTTCAALGIINAVVNPAYSTIPVP